MALVLQSRVSSCPGDPLTLLHPRLLPSPKEAAHTTADRAVDTAGVQVRLRDSELFRSRLSLSYARAVMLWQMEVTISVWCSDSDNRHYQTYVGEGSAGRGTYHHARCPKLRHQDPHGRSPWSSDHWPPPMAWAPTPNTYTQTFKNIFE